MGDEFAHEGGESEFGRFAGGDEFLIEGFQDGVVPAGDHGGHVESGFGAGASAPGGSAASEFINTLNGYGELTTV